MKYDLNDAVDLLSRTPVVLDALLRNLPEPWIHNHEGVGTWSPFDIVGHLLHGERTDWIERLNIILEHGAERAFEPFDRFAQLETSKGKTLGELLDEFAEARAENLAILRNLELQASDFELEGRHPALGSVTARELLATWVAHDMGHIAQVGRVLAKQYAGEVGPWKEYLPILAPRKPG